MNVKASAGAGDDEYRVPVGSPPRAFLRPVATGEDHLSDEDIRRLTDWRNRYVDCFLTEFQATYERTARWLVESVGPADNKILFMVDDISGRTFGYMGLASIDWANRSGDADAVVRGEKAHPLIMAAAERAMIDWAREKLGLSKIGAQVRSDNVMALDFNRFVGFRETKWVPLRRVVKEDMVQWTEDESMKSPDIYAVYLEYIRDRSGTTVPQRTS